MLNYKKIKEIKPKSENFQRCLNYVLFLLNRRDYSLKEIKEKLEKHKYATIDCEKVIDYILKNNYQSDERFAENYVKNYKHKYGKQKLRQNLLLKGISEDLIIQSFYNQIDLELEKIKENEEDNSLTYAENCLLKKFKNIAELKKDKEKWFKKDKPKIIRFMLSKGFSFSEFNHLI